MTRKKTSRELSDKVALSVINGEKTAKQWSEELGEEEYPATKIHQWVVAYVRRHSQIYETASKKLYFKEIKYDICAMHVEDGVPLEKLCRQYSVNMFTLKRWIQKYQEEKEAGTLGEYKFTREFSEWNEKDREEIIRYCTENDRTISEAADHFHRNYYQVKRIVSDYKEFLEKTAKGEFKLTPTYIRKVLNHYYTHGKNIYADADGARFKYYVVQWVVDHFGNDPEYKMFTTLAQKAR